MKLTISQEGTNPITIKTYNEKKIRSSESVSAIIISGFIAMFIFNVLKLIKHIKIVKKMYSKTIQTPVNSINEFINHQTFINNLNEIKDSNEIASMNEVKNDPRSKTKQSLANWIIDDYRSEMFRMFPELKSKIKTDQVGDVAGVKDAKIMEIIGVPCIIVYSEVIDQGIKYKFYIGSACTKIADKLSLKFISTAVEGRK